MLLSYQECISKYGSDYKLKKRTRGRKSFHEGKSAFYYHSLTDVIPGHCYLATKRTDTRIKDSRVKQSFIKNDIFDTGIIELNHQDYKAN